MEMVKVYNILAEFVNQFEIFNIRRTKMKVLVINCGSSSLKYQVLDMTNENLLCKGLVERIGMDGSVIGHEKIGQDKIKTEVPMKDHKDAIAQVLAAIQDPEHGVVKSMSELGAVGHRVVHAGEKYAKSVLITEEVIKALQECVQSTKPFGYRRLSGTDAGYTDGSGFRYGVPSDDAAGILYLRASV